MALIAPYVLPADILEDMHRRMMAGEYNSAGPVGLASLIQTARIKTAEAELLHEALATIAGMFGTAYDIGNARRLARAALRSADASAKRF